MKSNELVKGETLNKLAGVVGVGAGAGTVAAVGTAIGSAGLLGSIGSAVGLTVAVATPVGWILGGAALGGAALYGASKVIGGKGYSTGNVAANRDFNSDKEKQTYQEISKKLSNNVNLIAIELLEKLPLTDQFIIDFKEDSLSGLEKGTIDTKEVIKVCCELLNENYETYITTSQLTLKNIESFIKISTLFALCDADYSKKEKVLIREKVISFFNLKSVLNEVEINLIFKISIGEDFIESIESLDYFHLFNLLHTFILEENNNELLLLILNFLEEVAKADGSVCVTEEVFILVFEEMLISKSYYADGCYNKSLNILTQTDELFCVTNEDEDDKFYNKLKNIIMADNAYGYGLVGAHVLAIDDRTLFGSGTDGLVFTPLGIFTNQSDYHFISYHTLKEEKEKVEDIGLNNIEYFADFLSKIIKVNNDKLENEELNNEKEWHIAFSQEQLGIKSMQEINDLFESKEIEISDSCMVWKDGMSNWEKIEEVEELSMFVTKFKEVTPPALPSTPPPLPSTPPPLN